MKDALLILHPQARSKRRLDELLEKYYSSYRLRVVESSYPGHVDKICSSMLVGFKGLVMAGGGDGTLYEVVNSWAKLGFPADISFVPLPLGTANDYLYSFHPQLRKLSTFINFPLENRYKATLGRVVCYSTQGRLVRFFCVGATAGFSASVTARRESLPAMVPKSLSYLAALLLSLGSWRNTSCLIEGSDFYLQHPVFFNFNAANVKYYGNGMISSPKANPLSGHLDLVAMNLKLLEVLRALPENFLGRFERVPNVSQFTSSGYLSLTTDRPCLVQADGEVLGRTPMTVSSLAERLSIVLPRFSGMPPSY